MGIFLVLVEAQKNNKSLFMETTWDPRNTNTKWVVG